MIDEERKEELQKMINKGGKAEVLKSVCASAYTDFTTARTIAENKRVAWDKCRLEYEEADRELAEIDGRLKVISHTKKVKPIDPVILTIEQIKSIAEKVGIKLDLTDSKDKRKSHNKPLQPTGKPGG